MRRRHGPHAARRGTLARRHPSQHDVRPPGPAGGPHRPQRDRLGCQPDRDPTRPRVTPGNFLAPRLRSNPGFLSSRPAQGNKNLLCVTPGQPAPSTEFPPRPLTANLKLLSGFRTVFRFYPEGVEQNTESGSGDRAASREDRESHFRLSRRGFLSGAGIAGVGLLAGLGIARTGVLTGGTAPVSAATSTAVAAAPRAAVEALDKSGDVLATSTVIATA